MTDHSIPRTTIVAVLVATTAALVGRAWLQVRLQQGGLPSQTAADLSYLVVPVVLVFLLFPMWRSEKPFLIAQFLRADLCWRIALRAMIIGLLLRIIAWCQLIGGVSFGIYSSDDMNTLVGPVFKFQCATPELVLLGILVMAILVPVIEEVVHRGYVLSVLRNRGIIVSVLVSAVVFAVFHRMSSWSFVFLAGLVFGTQYWYTHSLWASVISHATINGLIQIDWRCLSGRWNPRAEDIPVLLPGIIATALLIGCFVTIVALLQGMATEARNTPR